MFSTLHGDPEQPQIEPEDRADRKRQSEDWSGILEDRCIPSDESKFNEFRDHAAGKK